MLDTDFVYASLRIVCKVPVELLCRLCFHHLCQLLFHLCHHPFDRLSRPDFHLFPMASILAGSASFGDSRLSYSSHFASDVSPSFAARTMRAWCPRLSNDALQVLVLRQRLLALELGVPIYQPRQFPWQFAGIVDYCDARLLLAQACTAVSSVQLDQLRVLK